MKQILVLFAFLFSLSSFAQNGYRYDVVPGSDNTYAIFHKEIKSVAYAATLSLTPSNEETTYDIGTLTGAVTINLAKSLAYTGDRVYLSLKANTTARVVTWGNYITGTTATRTIPASTSITLLLIFNGSTWVESGQKNTLNASVAAATDSTYTVTAAGGVSPYTYVWSVAGATVGTGQTGLAITGTTTGATVRMTRNNGTGIVKARVTDNAGNIWDSFFYIFKQ